MKQLPVRIAVSLFFLVALTLAGCGWFGSKKIVIDEALKALNSRKDEMIGLNGAVKTVDFYEDGSGGGIVIEYTYNAAAVISDKFDNKTAKEELIAKFKDNAGIKSILDHDVFVRFLFKTAEGEVFADTKLEPSDF